MKYQNKRRLRKHEHRSPFEITLDKTDEDEDENETIGYKYFAHL